MTTEAKQSNLRNEDLEDDDESIHGDDDTNVDIGVVNEMELTSKGRLILHSSTFYPCKLGGKPQWLDYKSLKTLHDNLVCESCMQRLSFLLQIYAPLNSTSKSENISNDPAFHRYLYVFICSNATCTMKKFKAYRSQMSQINETYSVDPPPVANTIDYAENSEDGDTSLNKNIDSYVFDFYKKYFELNLSKLCNICGFLSTKMCSKCKFIYYCSESHQKLDWITYKHKMVCGKYCSAQSLDEKGRIYGFFLLKIEIRFMLCYYFLSVQIFIEHELDKEIANENTIFPEYEILIESESLEATDTNDLIKLDNESKREFKTFHKIIILTK